ncbi:hypothetical protein IJF81_00635 [bacterium]|nr:hypothetical protein [bacterium]
MMGELSGLQIFKYLPAAKKEENSNCKKCGCPTCMAYALKLAKKALSPELCPYLNDDIKNIIRDSQKSPQKTVEINGLKVGGENVLYRHEKTFVNKTAFAFLIDTDECDWQNKVKRLENFKIERINEIFKPDILVFTGKYKSEAIKSTPLNATSIEDFLKLPIDFIEDTNFQSTVSLLIKKRETAIKDKETQPVCVLLEDLDLKQVCARASIYLCKYANMILFKNFDEALLYTLMTLRQNIFTDPQKPMQVEPKIYEFNNPDENSLIFITTNFALTFFAVAAELENLDEPSYLIVTPAEGMSVLTAWSAEKFTAKSVVRSIKQYDLTNKVINRKIIIPGLLAHMKSELEQELEKANLNFEIVIGTIEAFKIKDFVKTFER